MNKEMNISRPREANSKEANTVPAELGEPGKERKPRGSPLTALIHLGATDSRPPTPPFRSPLCPLSGSGWTGAQSATTRPGGTRVCLSLEKQPWLFKLGPPWRLPLLSLWTASLRSGAPGRPPLPLAAPGVLVTMCMPL